MSSEPSAALAAAIAGSPVTPTEDKLEVVRNHLRRARDLERSAADLEERLKSARADLNKLKHETLPTLFDEVGIDTLGIPGDGNLPAYDCELKPYYKAAISAEWPPERQKAAFDWLDENGSGDLIKTTIVIEIDRRDRKTAQRVKAGLDKAGVGYVERMAVPWNSLTSFIREQIEKYQRVLPLDTLGATVGNVVNLKPRKEK